MTVPAPTRLSGRSRASRSINASRRASSSAFDLEDAKARLVPQAVDGARAWSRHRAGAIPAARAARWPEAAPRGRWTPSTHPSLLRRLDRLEQAVDIVLADLLLGPRSHRRLRQLAELADLRGRELGDLQQLS
ncbi:MAG: hypothetical protein R3E41_08340 [Burkholderiaceae bacterium]